MNEAPNPPRKDINNFRDSPTLILQNEKKEEKVKELSTIQEKENSSTMGLKQSSDYAQEDLINEIKRKRNILDLANVKKRSSLFRKRSNSYNKGDFLEDNLKIVREEGRIQFEKVKSIQVLSEEEGCNLLEKKPEIKFPGISSVSVGVETEDILHRKENGYFFIIFLTFNSILEPWKASLSPLLKKIMKMQFHYPNRCFQRFFKIMKKKKK